MPKMPALGVSKEQARAVAECLMSPKSRPHGDVNALIETDEEERA